MNLKINSSCQDLRSKRLESAKYSSQAPEPPTVTTWCECLVVFGGSGSGSGPCTVHLTSGHDWADVLQREDGQLLLRVDPDHAVTQTLHGQHAAAGRRAAFLHRPAGENTSVFKLGTFFWKISLFFRKWGHVSKERPTLESHGYFGRVRTFFFQSTSGCFLWKLGLRLKINWG